MRRDALYLADIVEAADAVAEFITGVSREAFLGNKLVRSGVLQQLTIMGEAATRLSSDLKSKYPGIEWADIVAFRNIAVHAYFSVDWPTVWTAAKEDAPLLRRQVTAILTDEFPDLPPRRP
jgi:uncharacterized protein with HEPN domain